MAFPDSDLELTCDFAFGADLTTAPSTWAFTDLSDRVLDNPITINHGVVVGNGTTKSAAATGLTLLNDDGALTPMLPTSPYWPYVDVGTPARIRVRSNTSPWISDTFARTVAGGWGTPEVGHNWLGTTGFSVNGSTGQIAITTANTILRNRQFQAHYDALAQWDMSIAAVATGGAHVVGATLRGNSAGTDYLWAACEFGTGGTMLWTIRSVVAGNLGTIEQQVPAGITYTAGATVRCEVSLIGPRLRARAWLASGSKPATWTVDVLLSQLTGTVQGNYAGLQAWVTSGVTNTLPDVISIDNVTFTQPKYPRIEGYIADVRPSFQPGADGVVHSVVQVDIGGVGTRLEHRDAPALGPLRRSLQQAGTPPLAYWPCEDQSGSLSAASAFPGQPPMTVTGPAVFDFDTGLPDDDLLTKYGSTNLCSVAAGAKLSAVVPAPSTSTAWTVSMTAFQFTPSIGGGITEVRLMEWNTPASLYTRWALVATSTNYVVRAYNDTAGTSVDVATSTAAPGNFQIGYDVTATQTGSTITVNLYAVSNLIATGTVTATMGAVTALTGNPDRVNTTASVFPSGIRFLVGHFMVHDAVVLAALPFYSDGTRTVRADRAWTYEAAHRRLLRLCAEENIPCAVLGKPATTGITVLGPQQPGAFTDLATAAAEAESGGLLIEGGFGYVHLPRTARYNQAPVLTVDMAAYNRAAGTAATEVLVPKLDARGPNYWTVQRTGGSSSSAAAPAAYRDRRGTIGQQKTLDLLTDADTAQHANWRVHLNVDGQQANYPNFTLDFAANPGLLDTWWRCDIGSRVQRTNQPTIAGYGAIDQVIDGITETIAPRTGGGPIYRAVLDVSPAAVWDVAVYGAAKYGSATTTLAAAVTATATTMPVTTSRFEHRWSTTGVPYSWSVGGETVTVTAITAAAGTGPWTQTATVVRGTGGFTKTHTAGEQVSLATAARYGLSGGSNQ